MGKKLILSSKKEKNDRSVSYVGENDESLLS